MFHAGYYIKKLILSENLTLRDIQSQTNIPLDTFKRNKQLYEQLGNFRTILYSTVPTTKLHRNITRIKKELDSLSTEDQKYWITSAPELLHDPSSFVKVYLDWYQNQPPNKVFYSLDLFDNKLSAK